MAIVNGYYEHDSVYYDEIQFFEKPDGTEELNEDIQKLVYGQSIVEIIEHDNPSHHVFDLVLSNGTVLQVEGNKGCAGCGRGTFNYKELITCGFEGNVITKVEVESTDIADDDDYDYAGTFTINVYSIDKRIVQAEYSGTDNGYYGIGLAIKCKKEV